QLAELERIRAELASADAIAFLGYRANAAALLAGADICVSASVCQEAFGLGVLEPMAHGKAVVGTAVGGVPEIVEHDVTGLLVPPGDEAALQAAIACLLGDPGLRRRLGAAARARVAAAFRIEQQITTLSNLVAQGFNVRPVAATAPDDRPPSTMGAGS